MKKREEEKFLDEIVISDGAIQVVDLTRMSSSSSKQQQQDSKRAGIP